MFGFVSLGVSFASLVISCAALYWSRMARIEAAGAVERSRYALESSRKHVGLPYDHKIVHDWELRTQFGFAPQIKDDWTRRKDSDGVADSDDAFEVFSDGTYRIVPNSKDAADMLGISESTLSNKLTGKIRFNDAEIFSLSHWLGVPSDALLGLKPLEVA